MGRGFLGFEVVEEDVVVVAVVGRGGLKAGGFRFGAGRVRSGGIAGGFE